MMTRGKSRKSKPRAFNIVDIVIVAVAALTLFYIIYVSVLGNSLSDLGSKKVNIEYIVRVENVSLEGLFTLSEGEAVMSKDGKTELGKIVSLRTFTDVNNVLNAEIRVETPAHLKKGVYKINDTVLTVDKEISVRFTEYSPSSVVKCTNIRVK